jgi:hypothetical protein
MPRVPACRSHGARQPSTDRTTSLAYLLLLLLDAMVNLLETTSLQQPNIVCFYGGSVTSHIHGSDDSFMLDFRAPGE